MKADVRSTFGNTRVGAPLMQADPRVGVELPLRMLIWKDLDGTLEWQGAALNKVAAAAG